jgi:hypothetical protein
MHFLLDKTLWSVIIVYRDLPLYWFDPKTTMKTLKYNDMGKNSDSPVQPNSKKKPSDDKSKISDALWLKNYVKKYGGIGWD